MENINLINQFSKLFKCITDIPQKLSDAVQEELSEVEELSCIQAGLLDFNLIEEDIRVLHRKFRLRGDTVLGSTLVLNDIKEFMEIRTYVNRGEKTFMRKTHAQVQRVTNIPADVLREIQQRGVVELHIEV